MSTNFSKDFLIPSEWISQAEAARIRGVSRQAISKLIKKGRLQSINIGGHILVNRNEVENFEPKDAGRPKAEEKDVRNRSNKKST